MSRWTPFVDGVVAHRSLVWTGLLGLGLVAVIGMGHLRPELGLDALVPADPVVQRAVAEADARWGRDDLEAALVISAPAGSDTLRPATLDTVIALRQAALATPQVMKAVDLTTLPWLQHTPGILAPHPGQVRAVDFRGRVPAEDAPRFGSWKAEVLADATRVPQLLSTDGRHLVVLLTMAPGPEQPKDLLAALQHVQEAVEAVPHDGLTLGWTGTPVLRVDLQQALAEDQVRLVPWVGGVLLVVLLLTLGNWRAVVFPVVLAAASLVGTMGLLGWLGRPIGFLSLAWMMLIPVAAVADAVHLSRRLTLDTRAGHVNPLAKSMSEVGPACLVTTLTSMIGIGSMAVSGLPAVQHFALDGALGLAVTFGLFLVLGPLLAKPADGGRLQPVLEGLSAGAARLAIRTRGPVLAIGALLVGGGLLLGSSVRADYRLVDNLAGDRAVVGSTQLVDRSLGGSMVLSFDLTGDVQRAEVVHALEGVRSSTSRSGESWSTPYAGAEAVLRSLAGDRWSAHRPWLDATLAKVPPPSSTVSADGHARVVVRTSDEGAAQLVQRADTLETALATALAPLDVQVKAGGTALSAYRGLLQLPRELVQGLALATGIIALLIGLLLRSGRLALLSLLPNLFPLAVTWGLLLLLDWPLQLGTAVVFTLGLGLAVDDTIHVMARWRLDRDAVAAARETGTAVVITSLSLGAGLLVLLGSQFRGMTEFGVLASCLVAAALVADLFLLPALLSFLEVQRDCS